MRLLAVISLSVLAACSSNDKKDQDLGPNPVPDYDAEISLQHQWRHQVGQGLGNAFARLQPALVNDTVYAVDAQGLVVALAIENGQEQWQQDLDLEITSGMAVANGQAYLASSNGQLIALDTEQGDELWRSNLNSEVLALPTAQGNQLAVQTVDGKLHSINTQNGQIQWTFDSNLPNLSLRGTASPIFHQGLVIAGFANGKVVAVNADSGAIQWQQRIGIPAGRSELERLVDVDGRLLVRDDMLYVCGYQGHLVAIDLRNGKVSWKREASSYHGPLAGLGNLYIVSDEDHVLAVDDRSSSDVWVQAALQGRQLNEAIIAGEHIAVADYQGYIHLIKQLDGTLVGQQKVSRPALDWVRGGSHGMRHPSRHFSLDPGIRTRLISQGNYLLAISNSGLLTAFSLAQ